MYGANVTNLEFLNCKLKNEWQEYFFFKNLSRTKKATIWSAGLSQTSSGLTLVEDDTSH